MRVSVVPRGASLIALAGIVAGGWMAIVLFERVFQPDQQIFYPQEVLFAVLALLAGAGLWLRLRDSRARLQSIIESAVDGIIVIDARGRIESFNPAAERLFGYLSAPRRVARESARRQRGPFRCVHENSHWLRTILRRGPHERPQDTGATERDRRLHRAKT